MDKRLILRVHLLDDRYHGEGDWPPTPARLFQALVAGNAIGARLPDDCAEALRWLERHVDPPLIRAQRGRLGLPYKTFVPNNDLDAKGGDPARVGEIRVAKQIRPRHIDARIPILYGWCFRADEGALDHARTILRMADNLYQIGRGVDMAFASAALYEDAEGEALLAGAAGEIFRPAAGDGGMSMSCPGVGSLDSIRLRYAAQRERFSRVKEGRKLTLYFTNAPKARFRQVAYNPSPAWRLYELRTGAPNAPFRAWPQSQAADLVERVRDQAVTRLTDALPDRAETIERLIIGRGAGPNDKPRRVQIIPIPSIGHEHTNRSIRRLMVRAQPDCPLPFGDIDWAFSGLTIADRHGRGCHLVPTDDHGMLRHYGIESGEAQRTWRSVTPLVLPRSAARRRIDPTHLHARAKPGEERASEEARACEAVLSALRHAGSTTAVQSIRVQREPFNRNGVRAEAFAQGTRFLKERLWHVELRFSAPTEGPLLLGDGRYLGLGLMAPQPDEAPSALAFSIQHGLLDRRNPEQIAQALRRAVMSQVQQRIGPKQRLPPLVSGHGRDGAPLRDGHHRHLAFVVDLARSRVLLVPPNQLGHNPLLPSERQVLALVDDALRDFARLAAGPAGYLTLQSLPPPDSARDPLFAKATVWQSVTDYRPTRHAKRQQTADALLADLIDEVSRLRLPLPNVEVLRLEEGPRGGVRARLRLRFPVAIPGPLLLGRTRHLGGGVFEVGT